MHQSIPNIFHIQKAVYDTNFKVLIHLFYFSFFIFFFYVKVKIDFQTNFNNFGVTRIGFLESKSI